MFLRSYPVMRHHIIYIKYWCLPWSNLSYAKREPLFKIQLDAPMCACNLEFLQNLDPTSNPFPLFLINRCNFVVFIILRILVFPIFQITIVSHVMTIICSPNKNTRHVELFRELSVILFRHNGGQSISEINEFDRF